MDNFENLKEIKERLISNESSDFLETIEDLHPVDLLNIIQECTKEEATIILGKLPDDIVASLLDEEDDENRLEFLKQFSENRQKEILQEMSSDEITDFIGQLNEDDQEHVLSKLDNEDKDEINDLLKYKPDSAGGLMATEFISIRENKNIYSTIQYLQSRVQDAEMAYYLYVIDNQNHLKGVVGLRDIISSTFDTLISDIVSSNVIKVNVNDDQEEVAHVFSKYGYVMLPVVDDENVIKGVITIDDIVSIIEEESTEDIHRLAGLDKEEKVDGSILDSLKSRLPWLIVNLITALLASLVVSKFSSTIQLVVALAAINPIIAGMGGNAGTQSLTLIVRAIALGELDAKNVKKVLLKEIGVGIVSGLAIGLVVAISCQFIYNNYYLGIVAGLAMIGNMAIATLSGFMVPMVLKKLNIDPALASSVFVTTFTDCFGFFLFLGLATIFLKKLV